MIDTPAERPSSRVLRAAIAEPWAITEAGLELVMSVAARENDISPEALEAYRAKHVPHAERLTMRGPVAIIEAAGPMFRRANIFTAISGATSYDIIRRDLQAAMDDPKVTAIVLSLDTPGGEVTGAGELADAIREARTKKPIVAYVGGSAASAGYWLASQASEIVVAETAVLGSIGARAVVQDTSKQDAEKGRLEFVSSQSPGKRADLQTDEGKARVQRMVDSLAQVFIASVAKGRGVNAKTVTEKFGAGDVLIGAAAVRAGMADRLGSFESTIATLAKGDARPQSRRTTTMSDDARAERARIKAIITDPAAKGREQTAQHLAFESDMDAGAVIALLATLPAAPAKPDVLRFADGTPVGPRAQDAPGGLVVVDPREALPSRDSAAAGKAAWGNVLDRMAKAAG